MKSTAGKIIISSVSVLVISEPCFHFTHDEHEGMKGHSPVAIHEFKIPFTPPFHTHEELHPENLRGYLTTSPPITGTGDVSPYGFGEWDKWISKSFDLTV